MSSLVALADKIDACVREALKPAPVVGYTDVFQPPSPSTVAITNALSAIASELRAQDIKP
jgi:hypothetical protein